MTATTVDPQPVSSIRAASIPVAAARDLRLDFFRGLAMFFILLAHIPYNIIGDYVPSHWGWSDAAEIFVFCSGMASALAFFTYMHDLVAGRYRVPWEDEVVVKDGAAPR